MPFWPENLGKNRWRSGDVGVARNHVRARGSRGVKVAGWVLGWLSGGRCFPFIIV